MYVTLRARYCGLHEHHACVQVSHHSQLFEVDEWEMKGRVVRSMFTAHVQHMEALVDSNFIEARARPPLDPPLLTPPLDLVSPAPVVASLTESSQRLCAAAATFLRSYALHICNQSGSTGHTVPDAYMSSRPMRVYNDSFDATALPRQSIPARFATPLQ